MNNAALIMETQDRNLDPTLDVVDYSIAQAVATFWDRLRAADADFAYRPGQTQVLEARARLERMLGAISRDLRWDYKPGTYALNPITAGIIDALVLDAVNQAIKKA